MATAAMMKRALAYAIQNAIQQLWVRFGRYEPCVSFLVLPRKHSSSRSQHPCSSPRCCRLGKQLEQYESGASYEFVC